MGLIGWGSGGDEDCKWKEDISWIMRRTKGVHRGGEGDL